MANEAVRLNKKHGGKEFDVKFKFAGKLEKTGRMVDGNYVELPIWDTVKTRDGLRERRVLQFNVATVKDNRLKMELSGMEFAHVYLFSKGKDSFKLDWNDRHYYQAKRPDDTYTLFPPDWDKVETFGKQLDEIFAQDGWVEVYGHYEFETFLDNEGKEVKITKRIVDGVKQLNDGDKVSFRNRDGSYSTLVEKYATNFGSPEFKEVNHTEMQIGIVSTYQDETTQDTKVNAVVLTNGKERSIPKFAELVVHYKEVEGKTPLANAFATLNRGDFITVLGQDNNRAEYGEVEVDAPMEDDDPFANVDGGVKQTKRVVTGSKKGIEITGVVLNSRVKEFLSEEEMTPYVANKNEYSNIHKKDTNEDPFGISDEDLPF